MRRRVWEPHNYTFFYESANATQYPVCEADVVVRDYKNLTKTDMDGGARVSRGAGSSGADHQLCHNMIF